MHKQTMQGFLKYVWQHKKILIYANFIALFAALINTIIPLFMPMLVDELLLGNKGIGLKSINYFFGNIQKPYTYILIILAIVLILRLVFFLLNILQAKYFTDISKQLTYNLRDKVLSHLQNVSIKAYQQFGSAKANSILVVDIETIDNFFSTAISRLVISVLMLFGISIVMLYLNWKLALFILFFNPIVVLVTTKIARKVARFKKDQNSAFEIFSTSLSQTLDLFLQIRTSNKEKYFIDDVKNKTIELKKQSIKFSFFSDISSKFSFFIFLAGFEIFRAVSILAVLCSDLSIGMMMAIFSYLWMMMGPIQDIASIQYAYHNAKESLKRVNGIFELEVEKKPKTLKNPFLNTNTNSISLKNVSFAYEDKNIINNVSLEIKYGQKVAIIGASGSGKTTLANIIVGLYPLNNSGLFFDGIDSKDIGLECIRENVFLVLQNPQLFHESIRFNITLGKDFRDEEIWEALKVVQLDKVVSNLKDGLNANVGINGALLSGGQRQRLSLARMLLKNPNIVIFDESTSALDVQTESKVLKQIDHILHEKTMIFITHRLSTIKDVDYVYVLDEGSLIDEGIPHEIMNRMKNDK